MQSRDIKEIKAALWDQAFIGCTRVSCPMGGVVAIRRRKGSLLAMIRGWGHWYPVESVTIEIKFALPNRCVPEIALREGGPGEITRHPFRGATTREQKQCSFWC
jgi:hypothetical protein